MDEEKKKQIEDFDRHVAWLRKSVLRDDIYEFAEQTLMACDFFLQKLDGVIDLSEERKKDKLLGLWMKNVLTLRALAKFDYDGMVDISFKDEEDL